MFSNFFSHQNRAIHEIIWKNMGQPDRPQVTAQHGAERRNITDTHSYNSYRFPPATIITRTRLVTLYVHRLSWSRTVPVYVMRLKPEGRQVVLRSHIFKWCIYNKYYIFLSTTNKMQRYTIFFIAVNALHVSGGFYAHQQELKTVHTASGICPACLLLPLRYRRPICEGVHFNICWYYLITIQAMYV
jgi:hypothetical protein